MEKLFVAACNSSKWNSLQVLLWHTDSTLDVMVFASHWYVPILLLFSGGVLSLLMFSQIILHCSSLVGRRHWGLGFSFGRSGSCRAHSITDIRWQFRFSVFSFTIVVDRRNNGHPTCDESTSSFSTLNPNVLSCGQCSKVTLNIPPLSDLPSGR